MSADSPGRRGISPVIGVVLLVAIVVVLASGAAYFFLSLNEEREPQPNVVLEMKLDEDGITHRLAHEQGDRLDGDKITLRGVANPDAIDGSDIAAGEDVDVLPIDSEIEIVYNGEHGTTYLLDTFEAEQTVPEPDEGCDWVDSETNNGNDDATVDGIVVNCDVETDKVITVRNGGVVIGDTESNTKNVDADDATFYGDVTVDNDVNLQDGEITGSVTARTEGTKIGNSEVGGSITAQKLVEITGGSSVDGPVTSDNKGVKVLSSSVSGAITADELVKVDDGTVDGAVETDGDIEVISGSSVSGDLASDSRQVKVLDSSVSGAIVTDGNVKLDGATVDGDVYVDDSDFDCTDSTINGQDCGEYSPKDTAEYGLVYR